jgi:hypothetical protein
MPLAVRDRQVVAAVAVASQLGVVAMSWDAWLTDDRGHDEGEWNYTHNTNAMANTILTDDELMAGAIRWWTARDRPDVVAKIQGGLNAGTWWQCLDGLPGPEGAALLHRIIQGLEADPEGFRAMNPPNGWGNYDDLLTVLTAMRDRVPEWPTTWSTSG